MTKNATTIPTATCPNAKCRYKWMIRVSIPKKCPKCGKRL